MKALSIAATGMNAQQTNLEVIANNIANINTTGFKRARAEFSDLLYQTERLQGVPNRANQNIVPEGASIGLGVKTTAIRNLHIQGSLVSTGNKFDLALTGTGWFQIEGADGETLYTRAGAFNTNATGDLVTADGYAVQPAITVPADAVEIVVNKTGQVFARIDGQTELQDLGQLTLATFANEAGLAPLGDNLFQETAASGPANVGVPGDPGFATVAAGLPRKLQRRSGQGDHRADRGAARLRDELQGDPGCRRDGRRGLEEHQMTSRAGAASSFEPHCSASRSSRDRCRLAAQELGVIPTRIIYPGETIAADALAMARVRKGKPTTTAFAHAPERADRQGRQAHAAAGPLRAAGLGARRLSRRAGRVGAGHVRRRAA